MSRCSTKSTSGGCSLREPDLLIKGCDLRANFQYRESKADGLPSTIIYNTEALQCLAAVSLHHTSLLILCMHEHSCPPEFEPKPHLGDRSALVKP